MTDPRSQPNEDSLADLAYPYALDALDGAGRREVDARVRRASAAERREFEASTEEVQAVLARFAGATAMTAPATLRDKVMAAAAAPSGAARVPLRTFRERHRRGLRRALVAGVAAVVIGAGVSVAVQMWPRTQPGNEEVIQAAPDRAIVTANVAGGGTMSVMYTRQHEMAMVQMSGVPAPPPGKTYQLWTKSGDLHSAGLMTASNLGAPVVVTGIAKVTAFLVTVEPSGGSPGPTGDPVAVAAVR